MKFYLLTFFIIPQILWCQNSISEEIDLKNDAIAIPGTLSYPKAEHELPLVIFVHGSGNIDRNGNQSGANIKANYIKVLADSLNAKGIAFYRYDKRTATVSNLPKLVDITLNDLVSDVKTSVDYFKNDDRFNGIHLIGHSQGSLLAMLAVTDDIKSYTSIAGPSKSIDKTIVEQLNQQSEALGKDAYLRFEELRKTDTILQVNPMLMSLFAPQNQKFIKSWMFYEPSVEIKKLNVPVLILQGDADLQASVIDAEFLKKAKPSARLHIIPKMNHVLKEVNSEEENRQAYFSKDFPLSATLVEYLKAFTLSNQ